MNDKIGTLQLIDEIIMNPKSGHLADKDMAPENLDDQRSESKAWWVDAHKFVLDIQQTQSFYDETLLPNHVISTNRFVLPFDHTCIVFENPLEIKWSKPNDRQHWSTQKLAAMSIKLIGDEIDSYGESHQKYKAFLYFRGNGKEYELPKEHWDTELLAFQFILFDVATKPGRGSMYLHVGHFPCNEPKECMIDKDGDTKPWFGLYASLINKGTDKGDPVGIHACQEIHNRDSLVETIESVLRKISQQKPHIIAKPRYRLPNWFPRLPIGWPFTKGNLPKDDYICYLGGKQYVYEPGAINFGTGTKHRYRYDVRRHMRLVGGRIVWIDPYQRGSGKYIKKVYANRRTWFVNYIWYMSEKLTKIRLIEIFLVKIISFFRKRK